jgi:hypothetical protein
MLQSILFLLIIATVLYLRNKLRDTPLARLSATQKSLIALGTLVFLLLALTGKLGMLIPLFGAVAAAFIALVSRLAPILAPFFARHVPEWLDRIRGREEDSRSSPGAKQQSSSARTAYLAMTLDHQVGRLDGMILQGPHEGKKLSELSMKALVDLYTFYLRDDQESAKLLSAFIEQTFGRQWQNGTENPQSNHGGSLEREEALSILGLDASASEEDIIAAHRRLIQKVHPDRGGSDYLASRINQAKDSLLGRRSP